ncbi:RES family NAD+ phosphorylase [Algoriphagus antarcticus]|uniref:RES domain-containing protein n=1 Tax=Algoriphagus antarcticus TaxID=238540 RepID=A0A3E0D4T1_9BACT|nr:RES family NAD+ phosphorylase [Algoriphagus antarcticus]REG77503.1 RES domain-containing protein [Algoriphagus antarcticus]
MTKLNPKVIDDFLINLVNPYDKFLEYFLELKTPIWDSTLAVGRSIFRARYSEPLEEFSLYSDFLYPPSSSNYSRIGKPGDTWFYASCNYEACLAEMLPYWFDKFKLGSKIRVTFGVWQIRKPIKVFVIPDFEFKNDLAIEMRDRLFYTQEDLEFWKIISPYFFETTLASPKIYQLTSAFIESIFLTNKVEDNLIDGIVYPSIQHREKTNLAIFPNAIDDGRLIFQYSIDSIFHKSLQINEKGLPTYHGPFKSRRGIHELTTNKIVWV